LMSGNIKAADYKRNETLTPACLPVISDWSSYYKKA
jgi:hypothetical protein